jgi:uncharacterized repeat protein (TIGR03803 family)
MVKVLPLFSSRQFSARAVRCVALGVAFLFGFAWIQPKANAQLTIVHNFGDGTVPNDGTQPSNGLIQAPDGNFYGGAFSNVTTNKPIVYRMTSSYVVTPIQTFDKGLYITDELTYENGKLLVFTYRALGGVDKLFALTESGKGTWSKSIWYEFSRSNGPTAPLGPAGPLVLDKNGYLYGTAIEGGSKFLGAIFKVNASTHQLTVISSFKGPSPASNPATALLLASDGNFYGGTQSFSGSGEIFKVTAGGKVSEFYTFSGTAVDLDAPLIEGSDGNFYGIAGSYIFKLTPDATFTILHTLMGTDGSNPAGSLAQGPNGNLYGLCTYGGTANSGTLYEVSADGSSFTVLHNFGDGSIQNDGLYPQGSPVLGADNNFCGVTQYGGSAGEGTVFKISP